MFQKKVISLKVNHGQPTDGTGQVCIHFFIEDDKGIIQCPAITCLVEGKLSVKPGRGRLACDPNKQVKPIVRGSVTDVTMHSNDARAVTCPKCKQSVEYTKMMELLESM